MKGEKQIRCSSKLKKMIDAAKIKKMYYAGDMKNEWCYDDEITYEICGTVELKN